MKWYRRTMKTTIDRAGRVVIPLALRQRAGFEPGAELEVELDEIGIRLVRAVEGPELVVKDGRLLARPTAPADALPKVDTAEWIEQERDRWP
jgi:AbrB family looped-hinge helix DNA binding protein